MPDEHMMEPAWMPIRRSRCPVILVVVLVLGQGAAQAETIHLKDGRKIHATITSRNDRMVTVDWFGVPVTYLHDEITIIEDADVSMPSIEGERTPPPPAAAEPDETPASDATPGPDEMPDRAATDPRLDLPFSTAIITYTHSGPERGEEIVYISAEDNLIATEVNTTASMSDQDSTTSKRSIYDGEFLSEYDLERSTGMQYEKDEDLVTAIFGLQPADRYLVGQETIAGHVCNVFKVGIVRTCYWHGIVLKEESRTPLGLDEQFGFTKEAVDIALDVPIPPEKFDAPPDIPAETIGGRLTGAVEQFQQRLQGTFQQQLQDLKKAGSGDAE